MTTSGSQSFRERARFEADRYGSDAWVFVRELLQNARDAGARRVELEAVREGGRDRIVCRDDGGGMSFEHAREFLFTLYASSKRGRSRTAGRFGIGFWSVLRFDPEMIVVRSRPAGGEGWQVRLDGALERFDHSWVVIDVGTEVVLERAARGSHPEEAVRGAVLRDAPFLRRRGKRGLPLEVTVNGGSVAGALELPPPSLSFRRRGLRGVVGLGPEPRVEIFAYGLRVRDAATLDELLFEDGNAGGTLPSARGGLAPRVIINSSELSVLMARGDAREDRALRRLVAAGHRELSRLVRAELDRHARLSLPARVAEHLREAWSASWAPKALAGGLAAVVLLAALWLGLRPWALPFLRTSSSAFPILRRTAGTGGSVAYRDLEDRYRGPSVDLLSSESAAVDIRFRPAGMRPFFAALLVTGLDEDGRPVGREPAATRGYRGASCFDNCLEIDLEMEASAGLMRLPVATGHVVDPASVRLDGEELEVVATATGEPAVRFSRRRAGRLRYRSAPGIAVQPVLDGGAVDGGRWPDLPPEAERIARTVADLPAQNRAAAVVKLVRSRVRYDRSAVVVAQHRQAQAQGLTLFDRSFAIGAGDCDIQNSVVAAVLERAGVRARLAVGWIGADGRALPGLHAWVEYLGGDGRWRVADASVGGTVEPAGFAGNSAGAGVVQVGAAAARGWWRPVVVGMVLALATAVAGLMLGRRAWERSFHAGGDADLTDLLRGAASRPNAFSEVRPLFARRVVPLLANGPTSLRRLWAGERSGRLAYGSRRSAIALRAARSGSLVLDGDRAEGRAVAEVMGAVDLDRWQAVLDQGRTDPTAERVGEALTAAGERCRLRVAGGFPDAVAILDGKTLGLDRGYSWVVIDDAGELWRAVENLAARQPAAAALLLADTVVGRMGVIREVRSRVLSELAKAALEERACRS
ncbi:MAG: ATP-binding protein [Thermoanaerobaculales bacterium]